MLDIQDYLTQMAVGLTDRKTIEEAKQIKDKEIAEALELPAIKIHCSVLAEDSIKKAIEHWEHKKAGKNEPFYKTQDDLSAVN